MNRIKASHWALALVAASVCLASSPASAGDGKYTSRYESVERASRYARQGVGYVYRYAGTRACGYGCGRVAERGGHYVYDRGREWSNRYERATRNIGRSIGRRVRGR